MGDDIGESTELELKIRGAIDVWEASAIHVIKSGEMDAEAEQFARDHWTIAQELKHMVGETDKPIKTPFNEVKEKYE